jgi:hypothetical protein
MKQAAEIMNILEAFDLTCSYEAAAELAGVTPRRWLSVPSCTARDDRSITGGVAQAPYPITPTPGPGESLPQARNAGPRTLRPATALGCPETPGRGGGRRSGAPAA